MESIISISVALAACLALSFLFSGMEAGVLALSRLRVRQLVRSGNRRAQILHGYLESPEDFLWTILVGNTLANLAAVGVLVVLLYQWLFAWPALLISGYVVLVFLFYAFCELLPKMVFRMYPTRLSLALAGPFRLVHSALSPLVFLMTRLSRGLLHWTGGRIFTGHLFGSREEMRLFMQESAQGLTSEERMLINRVLDLQNSTVRNLTIPMDQVATVTIATPMSQVLRVCRERTFYQLPVWRTDGPGQRIAGLVSLRAVLYQSGFDAAKLAGDYLKPASFLDEDVRLEQALKRMQRSGQRMAVVLGRDGREIGIVTLQDILKNIFGEVRL